MTEWSLFVSKQSIQYHSNPGRRPKQQCWRSWSWMVWWRPTRPSRTNTKKDVLFIIGDWNTKAGTQEILGVTGKFGLGVQNEAGQRLKEFCQDNAQVIETACFNNTRDNPTPDGHHQMVNTKIRLIIFLSAKDGEALYSQQKTRPGADCGSDHELLIAKFRLKLKKVGKTTNHSGMTSIKSITIIQWKWQFQVIRSDRLSAWGTVDRGWWHCTGGSVQDHPQEKEMQKVKMVV